jgi:Fe-S-cluster formation regulator IscX/YfhJ
MAWSDEKKLEMFTVFMDRNIKYHKAMVNTLYKLGVALVSIDDCPEESEEEILEAIKILATAMTD